MTILEPVRKWLADFKGRKITLDQVVAAVARPRVPVLRVLDILAREEYLVEISDEPVSPGYGECGPYRRNPTWRINQKKDVAERPRVKTKPRNLRDKMWTVIRAKRRFTLGDLMLLATVSHDGARTFTKLLVRDGYVRQIGKDGLENLWLLAKDPGPKRPQIKEASK
ncbi:MAG: hypothetical protein OEY01_10870 [Desulfobulbaceae bacterium]|nr:hypothetical protein [Desulfobulbaceae bacterium]